MAVRTQSELLASIRGILADNTSDEAISLLDDISDTFKGDGKDWKTEYEQNDAQWRKRYMERFTETSPTTVTSAKPTLPDNEEEEEPRSYDSLFEEKED